jgi:tetratricopeptide (TPR) repeat protein
MRQMTAKRTTGTDKFHIKCEPNPAFDGSKVGCFIAVGISILIFMSFCIAGEETWVEVRSPDFIVISNDFPKQARRTARSFEQFRGLLKATMPRLKVDPGIPFVIYAAKDRESLKALLPEDRQGQSVPLPAGVFIDGSEQNYIVLCTDVSGDQPYREIYQKYVRTVIRWNFLGLPLWMSEGLPELFASADVLDGTSELGKPTARLLKELKAQPMIPLATLMAVTQDSPYYRQQDKFQGFYAQSWALLHYMMLENKKAYAGQLNELLALLQTDISEQAATKRIFDKPAMLERSFYKFAKSGTIYPQRIPVVLDSKEDQYTFRTLLPVESLALRGELLVQVNRLNDARVMLEQALRQDRRSTAANQGMGLLYEKLQDLKRAQKYFEAAAKSDPRSFMAQYYAGHLENERADSRNREGYLRKALALNPTFVPACRDLYELLMTQDGKLPEALELARKTAALEPAEINHRINIVRILIDMNKDDDAYKLGENLLTIIRTGQDRKWVESLLDIIKSRRVKTRSDNAPEIQFRIPADAAKRKHPPKTPSVKTGPPGKAAGVIKSVKCGYPAIMDIVLDSKGKQQKLRAQNYYNVQYLTLGVAPKRDFVPCEELQSKNVLIDYLSVSGQAYSGLIKSIEIQK